MPPTVATKLVDEQQLQALIAQLEEAAGNDLNFLSLLVEVQSNLLGGQFGAVFVTESNKPPRVATAYPPGPDRIVRIESGKLQLLRDCVNRCRQGGKLTFFRVGLAEQVFHAVCVPLTRGGRIEGVSVVLINSPADPALTGPAEDPTMPARLAQVQTVGTLYAGHVAKRMLLRQVRQAEDTRLALNVLSAAHQAEHFEACCMAVCNALKAPLGASRVSLGWAYDGEIKLMAMSDTENIDRKQDLSRRLAAAMEECYDQAQAIAAPHKLIEQIDEWLLQAVARCHQELLGHQARPKATVCSVPLRYRDKVLGALTIERDGTNTRDALDNEWISCLQAVADLITPRLQDRELDDQFLVVKVWRHTRATMAMLTGPQHIGWKLVGLSVVVVIAALCLIKWDYRVDASFTLDAGQRRVYAAAFPGFIDDVTAEMGQIVRAGDTLAKLDDRELQLQLAEVEARLQEVQTRRYQALAAKELADARRAAAIVAQYEAQRDLLKFQIDRASLVAAEDGVVLAGDWKQKIGTRVELGTPVFEVAPLDQLRATILVDEADIDRIELSATGELATRAYPDMGFPFRVTRIVPLAEPREGRNVFEVRAELDTHAAWMRPGMEGKAKIDAGRARLIWILTHKVMDFLRLKLWV